MQSKCIKSTDPQINGYNINFLEIRRMIQEWSNCTIARSRKGMCTIVQKNREIEQSFFYLQSNITESLDIFCCALKHRKLIYSNQT